MFSQALKQQVRFKRTKALSPETERVIAQLSVMSAGRKQPRLLKLCDEDYIKHRTVQTAWNRLKKERKQAFSNKLHAQYNSMQKAMDVLKETDAELFAIANEHGYGKRFPLEMRVPTEFPARNIWFYDYYPKQ